MQPRRWSRSRSSRSAKREIQAPGTQKRKKESLPEGEQWIGNLRQSVTLTSVHGTLAVAQLVLRMQDIAKARTFITFQIDNHTSVFLGHDMLKTFTAIF